MLHSISSFHEYHDQDTPGYHAACASLLDWDVQKKNCWKQKSHWQFSARTLSNKFTNISFNSNAQQQRKVKIRTKHLWKINTEYSFILSASALGPVLQTSIRVYLQFEWQQNSSKLQSELSYNLGWGFLYTPRSIRPVMPSTASLPRADTITSWLYACSSYNKHHG